MKVNMRAIQAILCSFLIGWFIESNPKIKDAEILIAFTFFLFMAGVYILILDNRK